MVLSLSIATENDAAAIAVLRTAVAARLTDEYGQGHWSSEATEKGVMRGIQSSRVIVARSGGAIVGTLRLATKKPWAIDPTYFVAVQRPLYLVDMAVASNLQRQGIGRRLCEEARALAAGWPAQAIRLDAYATPAGAGGFYAKCGFREVGRVTYRKVPLIYFEALV